MAQVTEIQTVEQARAAVETAEERLAALEAEAKALPGKSADAIQAGDIVTVAELRRRQDHELPSEIFAAKANVLRAKIAWYEARGAAAREPLAEAKRAEQAAYDELKAAQKRHIDTQREYSRLANQIHGGGIDIGQLRLQLDALLAEAQQSGKGPLVRSTWQAR